MSQYNTFFVPLFTPIYIQNKTNNYFLSFIHSSSLNTNTTSTSDINNNQLIEDNNTQELIKEDNELIKEINKYQLILTKEPMTSFIYNLEGNFYISNSIEDIPIYFLEYKEINNELIINLKENNKLNQIFHIGKSNKSNEYGYIRCIKNTKLKLLNNFKFNEENKEEEDNYLWKFKLKNNYNLSIFSISYKYLNTSDKYFYISKDNKLFVTVVNNNLLKKDKYLLQLNVSSSLFGNNFKFGVTGFGSNDQLFKITMDGFIFSKISKNNKNLVVTFNEKENKIELKKFKNSLNQKWIIIPNNKNKNKFRIHSLLDPLLFLNVYKNEKYAFLCLQEFNYDLNTLQNLNEEELFYWTLQ
ncbi:hypothetical protein ABK040_010880 [Willaertia magna]